MGLSVHFWWIGLEYEGWSGKRDSRDEEMSCQDKEHCNLGNFVTKRVS